MEKRYQLDSRFSLDISYEEDKSVIKNVVLYYKDAYTQKEYLLEEKTPEEILNLRIDPDVIGFVFRVDSRYFFTDLGMLISISIGGDFAEHLCGKCSRCFASEDPKGCQKVRDRVDTVYHKLGRVKATTMSKRLEKYPFIITGIEVFNNDLNSHLVVNCCEHFHPDELKKKKIKGPISKIQVEKKQFEEVQTQEVQLKKKQSQESWSQEAETQKAQTERLQKQEDQRTKVIMKIGLGEPEKKPRGEPENKAREELNKILKKVSN